MNQLFMVTGVQSIDGAVDLVILGIFKDIEKARELRKSLGYSHKYRNYNIEIEEVETDLV